MCGGAYSCFGHETSSKGDLCCRFETIYLYNTGGIQAGNRAANVTRADAREFLQSAAEAGIKPEFQEYGLRDANQALLEMKQGKIQGAKVLSIN